MLPFLQWMKLRKYWKMQDSVLKNSNETNVSAADHVDADTKPKPYDLEVAKQLEFLRENNLRVHIRKNGIFFSKK